jgi:hypothetical protein
MPIKKSNINRLKAMVSRGSTKAQQEKVVKDYEDRKIANYLTAENLVLKLQSSNKKVVEKALREVLKYEDTQPVTGRLTRETEAKTYSRVTGKTTDADAKRKYEDQIKLNVPLKGKFTQEEAEEYKLQAGKIKRLNESEDNKKVKVRTRKKIKESVNKIRNAFRKYMQPKVTYKSIDRAMTTVEISVAHYKKEDKEVNAFLGSLRHKIEEAARKLLTLKPNIKIGLGINADFVKVNGGVEEADSQINNTIMTKHQSF